MSFISPSAIILIGLTYYFIKDIHTSSETQIYSGIYINQFEWVEFISCTELPANREYTRDLYHAGIQFKDENAFFKKYQSLFENDQRVFLKVRGRLVHSPDGWMSLSNAIMVDEVLEVKHESDKECTPPEPDVELNPPPTFAPPDISNQEASDIDPAGASEPADESNAEHSDTPIDETRVAP